MDEHKYTKDYKKSPSELPPQPSVRSCANCGYPVEVGTPLCPSCGQAVWHAGTGGPMATPRPAKNNAASLLLVVAVAVMLAVGGAVAFFLFEQSAPQPAPVTPVSSSVSDAPAKLMLAKNQFTPGEEIKVKFIAPADYDRTAWVGIIPATVPHGQESVNDQYDLAYQYLEKRTSGELKFQAPKADGMYDLRMNNTDSNGRETASVTFAVKSPKPKGKPAGGDAGLFLGKTEYAPGETIKVRFWAPTSYDRTAWVGVIPAKIPHGIESVNDQYDLSYQYLENRAEGQLTFKAPTTPGKYDLRLNTSDSNGKEAASVSFIVRARK